jgi:hypothetical protein
MLTALAPNPFPGLGFANRGVAICNTPQEFNPRIRQFLYITPKFRAASFSRNEHAYPVVGLSAVFVVSCVWQL